MAYVDADSRGFANHFVCGLVGPLVCGSEVSFVKAFYRRPFDSGPGGRQAEGGGRVTELTARPLLAAFYPDLASIRQPSRVRSPRGETCCRPCPLRPATGWTSGS